MKYRISVKNILLSLLTSFLCFVFYIYNAFKRVYERHFTWFGVMRNTLIRKQFTDGRMRDDTYWFKRNLDLDFYHYFFRHEVMKEKTDGGDPFPLVYFSKGFSFDKTLAKQKAIGELLERVPFLYYKNKDLPHFSPNEAEKKNIPFLHPKDITVFTPEQRNADPSLHFTDDSQFHWVEATEILPSGEEQKVHIPAQTVFWYYHTKQKQTNKDKEPYLRPPSTHGGAGYYTKWGAIKTALFEWCARDGFFQLWLSGSIPQKIDIDTIPYPVLRKKIRHIQKQGLEIHFCVCPLSCLSFHHNMFCVVENKGHNKLKQAFYFGSGYGKTLEDALSSALDETISLIFWTEYDMQFFSEDIKDSDISQSDMWADPQRVSYYQTEKGKEDTRSFLSGENVSVEAYSQTHTFKDDEDLVVKTIHDIHSHLPSFRFFYYLSPNTLLNDVHFQSVKTFATDIIPMYHAVWQCPTHILKKRGVSIRTNHPYPRIHPFP